MQISFEDRTNRPKDAIAFFSDKKEIRWKLIAGGATLFMIEQVGGVLTSRRLQVVGGVLTSQRLQVARASTALGPISAHMLTRPLPEEGMK